MASERSSPIRRAQARGETSVNNGCNDVNRQVLQASIAKAVELRALHAALLQGGSLAPAAILRNATSSTSSPVARSHHLSNYHPHDYPIFTPSYEDEQVPSGRQSRALSGNWEGYGQDIETIAADTSLYNKAAVISASEIHDRLAEDYKSSVGGSCASSCRKQSQNQTQKQVNVFGSSSPNTEFMLRYARRNSLGDFSSLQSSNNPKPATNSSNDRNFNSSIVVPLTDTHHSLMARPKSKGISFSWLFHRNKKKESKYELSSPCRVTDQEDQLSDIFKDTAGMLSVEKLKKQLMKATEEREAALMEVSEMRSSLGDLKQKLEFLESYCMELKKALKVDAKHPQKLKNFSPSRQNDLMPVSEDVMVEGFLQIVSEARLSVNQFCRCLVAQVEETEVTLIDSLNILLQPYKLSLHSKSSKSVLYHLEAIINQTLYQDFENPIFQQNGAPKHLEPHQDCQAQFTSYVALRNLSWNEVLKKGTKYYSEEFSKFCDEKMSSIISLLNWTNPWPEQLLQVFFVTAKCIWLLHLLAFSFHPPLTIMRVAENAEFDPRYMEDMGVYRHRSQTEPCRVKIMVMPGFYINDKVLRCKVIAKPPSLNSTL